MVSINETSCDFRWVTGPWESCSHTCGTEGSQSRMVYCVRTAMINATQLALAQRAQEERSVLHNDSSSEARRRPVPEVVFDADQPSPMPTLDSWQPTIRDHTVSITQLYINHHSFLIVTMMMLNRNNWPKKTRCFTGIRTPSPILPSVRMCYRPAVSRAIASPVLQHGRKHRGPKSIFSFVLN